jgi:outer membrane protein OmpA-like peptidoglycan-associated protein
MMMPKSSSFAPLSRACAASLCLLVAACQTPAPAPAVVASHGPSAAQRKIDVLRQYHFEKTEEGWELQMSGTLLFDFNSDQLDGTRRDMVARMGRELSEVGIDTLRVEGHTDDQGSFTYNERLSLRRAQAVAQVLGESGIPIARIAVHGYGHSKPIVHNATETTRKENRRVAIIVPSQ